jgi:hypothetical protein
LEQSGTGVDFLDAAETIFIHYVHKPLYVSLEYDGKLQLVIWECENVKMKVLLTSLRTLN